VPDPVQALAKILARLSDDRGQITIPGIDPGPPPPDHLADLPFDEQRFREQGGVLADVPLLTRGGAETYWSTWGRPVVTVSALEAVPIAESSNQVLPRAAARVGVRLTPGQDAKACLERLVDRLSAAPPFGCRVTVDPHTAADGWQTDTDGPYFDAAMRALGDGYGHPAAAIGCGGSIPFVGPFARQMGGIPALLLGVEDPPCRAHGENESLSLADFDSACRAAVRLYGEIGRINHS
jgi:acetylornithine deacetylase/succinyl-diaminopimelate desuccinylase-like protein